MKTSRSVQKIAPFTSSHKRHDDALGSGPEVEKTFHDDIDVGADFADSAKLIGSALLGAYLGRKVGKKVGRGLTGLSDALKHSARKSTHLTKQPQSGPPRPGLQWKPQTHRWIRPAERTGPSYKPSYDYERPTYGWLADPKRSDAELARSIEELSQESKDLSREIKELGRQMTHDMSVYELTDYAREIIPAQRKKLEELEDRHNEVKDQHALASYIEADRIEIKRVKAGRQDAGRMRKAVDYQQATTWPQQKQDNPFAIATSQAKKLGYDDFSDGSAGRKKRGKIAEAVKGIDNMNKSNDPMARLLKAVEGLKEGFIDGGQSGKPYTDSSKNIDTPKKKSELLPKDRKPPKAFMLKKEVCDCGCSNENHE